jgi:hypothetical protein
MPSIDIYECDKCGFNLESGWGGEMYVLKQNGDMTRCIHPGERWTIDSVLGEDASDELIRQRTGFDSDCVCLDCLSQFRLDLKREARICRDCIVKGGVKL